ncbi:hypothetical protein [Desulforamulus hydrothermalis]|uniref:hypothetical protein n=1 Tax=Desulforamulus hydrothermalis TaxID=412895 RepID=UPI000917B9CD|nr:hypothetical protein [Desulforamulus hydrothermalis]SHH19404.1 hypothetical protein SAMN02745177_01767 [Desulforamulus hydrothermalis Lam5 = DSM 18033]
MELFKDMEEKAAYVESLILAVTADEKITEQHRQYVPAILERYGLPGEYFDRIWKNMKRKPPLSEILQPLRTNEQKVFFIQELVAYTYLSGNYRQAKPRLAQICKALHISTKLEDIKKIVLANLPQIDQQA